MVSTFGIGRGEPPRHRRLFAIIRSDKRIDVDYDCCPVDYDDLSVRQDLMDVWVGRSSRFVVDEYFLVHRLGIAKRGDEMIVEYATKRSCIVLAFGSKPMLLKLDESSFIG